MEFRVLPKSNVNAILSSSIDAKVESLNELLNSKTILAATVLEYFPSNRSYLLNFSGKQLRLQSEAKLFVGEKLELRVQREGSRIEMEILHRSLGATKINSEEMGKGWSQSHFSPLKTVENVLDSNNSEISIKKIFQFLDVYFPGIDWNIDTPFFYWKLEDGQANGLYGRKSDRQSFYFHFESERMGEVDSHFYWKKNDFSDMVLNCVFNNLAVYIIANEKLPEFKKMLSSNSIPANDIIFHYSTLRKEKGDWIA